MSDSSRQQPQPSTAFVMDNSRMEAVPASTAGFVAQPAIPGRLSHKPSPPRRRRRSYTTWRAQLPPRLHDLSSALRNEPDAKARYLRLTRIGDTMPSIAEYSLHPTTRVPGCTSISHVQVTLHPDRTVALAGYSDARVSRGLVALVVLGLDGCAIDEVLSVTPEELVSQCVLRGSVTSTRITGVSSILRHVQDAVRKLATGSENSTAPIGQDDEKRPLEGRWCDRQGEDVAVLLSGGVDSSVALRLAQESGARAHAFYLKIWLDDELAHLGECPWEEDMKYATAVCEQAGVQLIDVPFQQAYWDDVVSYTVSEARRGRTPNPDVMCNSRIKFGAFFSRIGRDFDRVVTGHYARRTVCEETGLAELRLSDDAVKDQTYFLAHLRQDQVSSAWFPLGEFSKQQVREMAMEYDLPNKARRDSQGICFLGKLKFDEFLGHHLGYEKGQLVEFETGQELGMHRGYWFFTIGQRRGVGLSGGPWYVVCKDVSRNIVFVSKDYNGANRIRRWFLFEDPMWIAGRWPDMLEQNDSSVRLRIKTRHAPSFVKAVVTRLSEYAGRVDLEETSKGVAPGQFAAFYDDEGRCLGSGVVANDVALEDAPARILQRDKSFVRLQAHFS